MINGVDHIAWDRFSGPEWYEPESVAPSLRRLAAAETFDEAHTAYDQVLFAVGNNSEGSVYPAAEAAIPFLLAVGLDGDGWAQWGALQTLTECVLFSPDYGPNPPTRDRGWVPLDQVIRDQISSHSHRILEIVTDKSEYDQVRLSALDLLDALGGLNLFAVIDTIEAPDARPHPLPGLAGLSETVFIDQARKWLTERGSSLAWPGNM